MKRIVVCCDGTWNRPDQKDKGRLSPSNVTKFALAIDQYGLDEVPQQVYYHTGVGTGRWDRLRGGAFGHGLSRNIRHVYGYLVENFEPGDELYLFGFSRGAYTVRSLAGMIRNCGVLRREERHRIMDAFKLYRRRDPESHPGEYESQLFRRSHSHETRVKCIGVWDTVGALGVPLGLFRWVNWVIGLQFHDVELSRSIDNAYQALAVDEKRRPFAPAIWRRQASNTGRQNLDQVWFAGVHTNIGGGYTDAGLSDITFEWMTERAESCDLSIDKARLPWTISPNHAGELRNSRKGLYRLLPTYTRPVSAGNSTTSESIDESIYERISTIDAYRPGNIPSKREAPLSPNTDETHEHAIR